MSPSKPDELNRTSPFRRYVQDPEHRISRIGSGEIGGKALGLAFIDNVIASQFDASRHPDFRVTIPRVSVVCTKVFEGFMNRNSLWEYVANRDNSDAEIARTFLKADFPAEITGDLMALVSNHRLPLAVRSSSLLEDALANPFAGVYATKMIPNDSHDPSERFRRLTEAIKYVWASTYFHDARDYLERSGLAYDSERMAVIIQEVVGQPHNGRFYPDISGVTRSFSWYPIGRARPDQGVVQLALGLGKTIVDGGLCWIYCPAMPKVGPPVGSVRDRLETTQTEFWSVRMGKPPKWDPAKETEYMDKVSITEAEKDGVLSPLVSTYDGESDRLLPGTAHSGPRVLDFAPILQHRVMAFNELIRDLMELGAEAAHSPVEIEFAGVINSKKPHDLALLQIRPMAVAAEEISLEDTKASDKQLLFSDQAIGHGLVYGIHDVVYVRPESWDAAHSRKIADEIGELNRKMLQEGRPYLLIGFGRWGSSDPWLGIPVTWSQISGAQVIVEVSGDKIQADLSQGSHFFHNLSAFGVCYLSIREGGQRRLDWEWLAEQEILHEGNWIRHIRTESPLVVRVDGRQLKGVIEHG